MSEMKRSVPTHPSDGERAIRRILRKYAVKAKTILLSRACHSYLENLIRSQIALLERLKREAERERRGKPLSLGFRQCCRELVEGAARIELGPLSSLDADQIIVLEKVLDAMLDGIRGRDAIPGSLDPMAFLSFQKKIFVQPKKRGPKSQPNYDVAFARHQRGEEVSSIARDMEPNAYERDPVNTLQRYCNAFKRRRRFHNKAK
jgi:hypothetical protein